jgi:hypothetical protein
MRRFLVGAFTALLLLLLAVAIRFSGNINIRSVFKNSPPKEQPQATRTTLLPSPTKEVKRAVSLSGTFLCLSDEFLSSSDETCPPAIQQGTKRYALDMSHIKTTWSFYEGESIHVQGVLTPIKLLHEEKWLTASLSGLIDVESVD